MKNKRGNLGTGLIEELKIGADKLKDNYESKIKKIVTFLDKNESGTINLQEFRKLHPNAAQSLFDRFDLDHNGELDVQEFKDYIHSDKLATIILKQLQAQEYEKNIIEIFDFLLTDLSESISLKELNSSYPDAANYLFTRYGLDESCNLSVKDLKRHINSYTRSKEFVDVLKEKNKNFVEKNSTTFLLIGCVAVSVASAIMIKKYHLNN
jgi:hypothetical protein